MKITYRPEIDGLRAIAVVAVILYHAQVTILGHQSFKGGFLGVDIFFVISGYLITSIILKELVTTGHFSFKDFYERRIRRILPALLLVMLVSIPFAWIYLLPHSFLDFSKSILSSLGFSSNFYFHYSGQVYGTESGLLKPFLHTWSLSVEEQYYLIFPILLFLAFKYFNKYIIYILILGFIISLGLADWGSRNHPSINFYVLPTRAWELLAGSILAYLETVLGHRSKHRILILILPSLGLFLIGHSILFFNDEILHPSFYTLSPVIGVCLIIWFSHKDELITRILSSNLFIGVGLISYSLYLWHYPIFAFSRILEFTEGNVFKEILLGLIILLLSIFSYYYIERPARNKRSFKSLLFIIFSIILLIIFNLYSISEQGFISRVPEIIKSDLSIRGHLKNSRYEMCQDNKKGCFFNTQSTKKVFIIGDSHMGTLAFGLKDLVIEKKYQFITSIWGGCIYFPGFNKINVKTKKISKYCNNKYFMDLENKLKKEKKSIIIIGGRFPLYLTNRYFNNKEGGVEGYNYKFQLAPVKNNNNNNLRYSFNRSIRELSKENYVILVYPIPEVGWHLSKKILGQFNKNLILSKKKQIQSVTTSFEVYKNRNESTFNLLDSIHGENIYRVYPHTLFCNTNIKNRCLTHSGKNIFYVDYDHPSIKGAEMINDLIMKEIETIELEYN